MPFNDLQVPRASSLRLERSAPAFARGEILIPYHGGPFSDRAVAAEIYRGRHAMVSFVRPEQLELIAECAQSFALDNGAFTAWRAGRPVQDWEAYYRWVAAWRRHPGCDFALIPDVIEGSEDENDALVADWPFEDCGVPVYHLDESLERLLRLSRSFTRIALGSNGCYRTPGSLRWWDRMTEIMAALCDEDGRPRVRLHGLRMLSRDIVSATPLASADSTAICRNVNLDSKWHGTYTPATRLGRALVLRERIESVVAASRWLGPDRVAQHQSQAELFA